MTVRLWAYLLVPLPAIAVCVTCYAWQLGFTRDILAPVSLASVCGLAFVLALRGRG